jgi:hypothetical protein
VLDSLSILALLSCFPSLLLPLLLLGTQRVLDHQLQPGPQAALKVRLHQDAAM